MTPSDRVEVILRRLGTLPTLGAIAVRLLELTADETADAAEVVELVGADPALASRVIALCRCHERGRASQVTTVERAVLLLGFEAVRTEVLSIRVFEAMDGLTSPAGERRGNAPVFDRRAFWLHSLAVAVASRQIAMRGTLTSDTAGGEAYVAGLLHDIGQLVLHVLLPESFDQVCRVAETHSASLDHACRRIIGLDTHTAGRRLGECWKLPEPLVDAIWLNGQPHDALPLVPHRALISVVSLADALVRSRYINPGGHWSIADNLDALAVPVGIGPGALDEIAAGLHDEVAARAEALGLGNSHDPAVLLRLICRANESLARANTGMRQRERLARRQSRLLKALDAFHDPVPAGCDVAEILSRIASSAAGFFGGDAPAAMHASADGDVWEFLRLRPDGSVAEAATLEPDQGVALDALARDLSEPAPAALAPWLARYFDETFDVTEHRLVPLACGGVGCAVVVLADPAGGIAEEPGEDANVLVRCWQAALAAAGQHDRAALLAERLVEANRVLLDAQEALARSRTTSTLGEVAAGAAHEMNNPLTVIAGRSQLLAGRLEDTENRGAALEISAQAHRLSDMITALRSFAEPIVPDRRDVDLTDLVVRSVQDIDAEARRQVQISTVFAEALPPAHADPDLLSNALGELVRNAIEAKGSKHIELRVQTEPLDDRLKIEVRDDGEGLDEHTLRHAFDPFFSARPAGRQAGLGLARARRFVEAHGGQITLVNGASGGAVASIWLKGWRAGEGDEPEADHRTDTKDPPRTGEREPSGSSRWNRSETKAPSPQTAAMGTPPES